MRPPPGSQAKPRTLHSQVPRLGLRIGRELGWRAAMHDAALAHDENHIGVPQREGELLLDQQDRRACLLELLDGPPEFAHD